MNKLGMPELADKLVKEFRKNDIAAFFDTGGSIGKRYRRQDEAGTPFGITVDHDTMEDNTITLRDRDTMKQERISIDQITSIIKEKI
jgi:glycyl-tRNA synthetase